MLMIGVRRRTIRESKNLSQGDIEQRTGMLRCYTSRVETATQFRPSIPWRSTLRRSKFRCISFSMIVKRSRKR